MSVYLGGICGCPIGSYTLVLGVGLHAATISRVGLSRNFISNVWKIVMDGVPEQTPEWLV
jgi:hypothetical protein